MCEEMEVFAEQKKSCKKNKFASAWSVAVLARTSAGDVESGRILRTTLSVKVWSESMTRVHVQDLE